MKIKKSFALTLLSVLALAGCTTSNKQSGGDVDPDPDPDTPMTASEYLQKSLEMDYTNCTVSTGVQYKENEDDLDTSEEYSTVYYYNDYAIVYSEIMKECGYDNPYLYYHDYQGKNLLYFEPDEVGGKEAWLEKYYTGTPYALINTCFYLPAFLEEIDVDYTDYYEGIWYITDEDEIARLNEKVFCGIWELDIQNVCILLDEEGKLNKIYLFEDADNEDEYGVIQLDYIGNTGFVDSYLPPEPNEDNVMEYWEYKGWNGPHVDVFPNQVTVSSYDGSIDFASPVSLEIEEQIGIKWEISYPEVDESKHNVYHDSLKWVSSDESVATVDYEYNSEEQKWIKTIKAVSAGTCEIYAIAEGAGESYYDTEGKGVSSNHITVNVAALAPIDKTGAKYDLYFSSITDTTLTYCNWVTGEGVDGTATVNSGKVYGFNELFYEEGEEINALILNPDNMQAEASVIFQFDQEVSKMSFYYGMYYDHTANIEKVKSVVISSSKDGETWNDIDVTEEVKSKISYENLKLLNVEFTSGTYVKITIESTIVGAPFAFATSNIVLY